MRFLVLYHAGFTHTRAVFDYLDAFRRYSRQEIEFFNVDQRNDRPDFSAYDALLVNFCAVSLVKVLPVPEYVEPLIAALRDFAGAKLLAVQDEYDFTDRIKEFIARAGFQIVLTCVPPAAIGKIYPEFPGLRFENVLTGYIADEVGPPPPPLIERDISIGYRGRELPWRLGDLGWHKAEIGRRFKVACARRGMRCDIEIDEASRLHSGAWLGFVRRCRVMLGSPSGANVFDFDGSLHRLIADEFQHNNNLAYADVRDLIEQHKVDFDMGQISSRVFEAIVSKTALAMLRGGYSGVLEPDLHYLPVEWDYSNIEDVIEQTRDIDAMEAIARRAFDHVVGNPGNHYDAFIARIDRIIDDAVAGAPAGTGHPKLPVTRHVLGNDPYLIDKLLGWRRQVEDIKNAMQSAAEGRLQVMKRSDGSFSFLKFGE